MRSETKKLFHVVDASGTDYFIAAEDLGDAFRRFKKWIADGDEPDSWEDPQSISEAGELVEMQDFKVPA